LAGVRSVAAEMHRRGDRRVSRGTRPIHHLASMPSARRSHMTAHTALFGSWSAFAIANGEPPGRGKEFAEVLKEASFKPVKHTPRHHSQRGISASQSFGPMSPTFHHGARALV